VHECAIFWLCLAGEEKLEEGEWKGIDGYCD